MNKHQLFKYGIIVALLVLWAVLIVPAMACEPQTCPPGEVWGVNGQDCHQVYVQPVYGSCNTCPTHQECDQTCQYTHCNNGGQSCTPSQHHTCEYDQGECMHYASVYDFGTCPREGYISCGGQGQHKEKQIITPGHFEEQCQDTYGCVAGCDFQHPCPEGYHCEEGVCMVNPPTPVCGVNFCTDQDHHCESGECVENSPAPVVQSSAPPMQFWDPFWVGKDQQCAGLGGGNAIQLKSHDNEQLYVTLTHNGFFSAQVTTHDPESDDMFAQACKGRTYYRSTCSFQRLSSASTVSFTITGTRDFVVYAVPDIQTDNGVTTIQIINHDVDFSGVSDGRVLDMHFMRSEGMAGCPQRWLAGVKFYGPQ